MSEIKVNKISPRTNCGTVTVGDSGDSVSVTAGVPVTINGDLKSSALKAPVSCKSMWNCKYSWCSW